MKIKYDELWLCEDCLFATINGDFTGLDYDNNSEQAQKRMDEIEKGLNKFGDNLVPNFDSETNEGIKSFCKSACDCCGSGLAGSRHRFAVFEE